ncbi:unnamed protein product [Lactuca saligna]|uniref:Uncharacterized protein n=1 Tax=Lactuca saligna TaxID=75948 RepID=A0AA36DZM3_LACSI|nr:unnamed protein product [Lactuca saligna]
MTYECITFLKWFMQESIEKLYYHKSSKPLLSGITANANEEDYAYFIFDAYETDGIIFLYVDHDGQGIENWFGSDIEEEDGGENKDEIDNLRDVEVYINEDIIIMNKTHGDEFLTKLCAEEEDENDNIDDDDEGEKSFKKHTSNNLNTLKNKIK